MDKTLSIKLSELLLKGDFKEAKNLIKDLNYETLKKTLISINFETEYISSYAFICSMLIEKETPELHDLAVSFLCTFFSYLEDAYSAALYHTKRAIELDPNNIEHKEFLLFFNEIPDQLINNEEAIKIAKEILKTHPDSRAAKELLQYHGHG